MQIQGNNVELRSHILSLYKFYFIVVERTSLPIRGYQFQKKMQIQGNIVELRSYIFLEIQILFNSRTKDFITYPWIPRIQFLKFI